VTWALAAIVILGVGMPIGAWTWTRLRPAPQASPMGMGYDPIDKWLLQQYSLTRTQPLPCSSTKTATSVLSR